MFLNDQVREFTLNVVAVVLGKIDPENTTLLRYSLSEFYSCQLADLESLEFRFYLTAADQGGLTHRLVRRVRNYTKERRYALRRVVKLFVKCRGGLYMKVETAARGLRKR